MNKHVVPLNESLHQQVQTLLPWFVADTLNSDERALVSQHLEICPDCRAEFTLQRQLQAIEPANEYVGGVAPDMERALARMHERISSHRAPFPRDQQGQHARGGSAYSWRWLAQRIGMTGNGWMPWAIAVQGLLLVAFSVVMLRPDDGVPYRTLSASGPTAPASGNLMLVFQPDTTEREMRRVLNQYHARLVDGPTVTDAYLVEVPPAQISQLRDQLAAEPAVQLAAMLRRAAAK